VKTEWRLGEPLFEADIDGKSVAVQIERLGFGWHPQHAGADVRIGVLPPRAAELLRQMPPKQADDTSKLLRSPMPGLLVSVAVGTGQAVRAGQELAVVEAMKMQNVLRAARDGTVKALHAAPGASLAVDQPILEFT
jgi:propionyl-CoA carboxylase alpha chain